MEQWGKWYDWFCAAFGVITTSEACWEGQCITKGMTLLTGVFHAQVWQIWQVQVDNKRESLQRQSRQASLSLTSASSQTSNLVNNGKNDPQHSISTVITLTASEYISSVLPLSPIILQSAPSSELDPTRISVTDLITPKDFEDITPKMYSDALFTNSICVNSSWLSSQLHSSSQDQFSLIAKTSCTVIPEPSSPTPNQISPTQAKKWEEEETLVNEFMEGTYDEETCIICSEKVWMGSWNWGSMAVVIDDLRELHVPVFSMEGWMYHKWSLTICDGCFDTLNSSKMWS